MGVEKGPKFSFAGVALLGVIAAQLVSLTLCFVFSAGIPVLGNSAGFLWSSSGSL